MKKTIVAITLFFIPVLGHAGLITTNLNAGGILGSVTISSGAAPPSTWVFVQSSAPALATVPGCNPPNITMTVNAGDLLIMGCNMYSGNTAQIPTDNVGDAWSIATSSTAAQLGSGVSYGFMIVYSSKAVGGSTTITPNEGGCNGAYTCNLLEYSGQAAVSPFDVGRSSGSSSSATTLLNTGPVATTQANELMVSFFQVNNNIIVSSQSGISRSTSTFVLTNSNLPAQDTTLANSTVYSSSWTVNSTQNFAAAEAAFKALVP